MTNPDAALDLEVPTSIHVIGAGGAGMSAIAMVLAAMGHRVSGSDLKDGPVLDRLRASGVTITVGHSSDNVHDVEAVTYSTAVPAANVEIVTARAQGAAVLRRSQMLAALCGIRRTVAVAGTHGKTTTSSMLSLILSEAGLRPSFIVGGEVNEVGSGARWDEGEWFVVEADESDGTFIELGAEVAVVTSVEPDHLGHYGSFGALLAAFDRFASEAARAVVCIDDANAAALARKVGAATYGTSAGARYRIVDVERRRSASAFTIERDSTALGRIELPTPGLHNVRNATAAAATAIEVLDVPFEAAARALGRYGGVARRFQFRGEWNGVALVEDYAHLPSEIAAVLATARDGGWKRVVCVFQPHRYTRTGDLWQDFADAFVDADVVLLTDIYAAGEAPIPGVTGRLVFDAVRDHHPDAEVHWVGSRSAVAAAVAEHAEPGDVCMLVGAGDLTSVPDELDALRP